MKFKGRKYHFDRSIETQISTDYVPDWGLFHALRESFQNAFDEGILSGANVEIYKDEADQSVYIKDTGRGVDFEDILLIGASGKRGLDDVVGQHGEGEVISFVVAARNDVEKMMASQDWLVKGRLAERGKYEVLVLDVYRSPTGSRKGTAWFYKGPGILDTVDDAKAVFRSAHKAQRNGRRKRIIGDKPGQLYTRGMVVNKIDSLSCGYDLDATPGRDRAGFTWPQVESEVEQILTHHAKAEDVAQILKKAMGWNGARYTKELELNPSFDYSVVKRAVHIATYSRRKYALLWSAPGDEHHIADAKEQGLRVLGFGNFVPDWIRHNLPNVREAVQGKVNGRKESRMPSDVETIVGSLTSILPKYAQYPVTFVSRFEESSTLAVARNGTITICRRAVKDARDIGQVLMILVHEAAHIVSGSPDCSRGHAGAIEQLAGIVAETLATDVEARAKYRRAMKALKVYKRI